MTKKNIFTDIQKADIVKKYLSDKNTIKRISLDYGISQNSVKSILRELNIKTRKASETSRKYFIDETYFNNIDSYDKAYFLGLLMADGYNNENRGAVTLILVKKDRHILERFTQFLNSNKSIRDINNKSYSDISRMEICSSNISQKLAKLGCMQTKSFKLEFPSYLDKDLIRHFIRGYFDGDGCFSYRFGEKDNYFGNIFCAVINFTSTENFCLYLKDYFENYFDIHSSLSCRHISHNNNNRTLHISGNKQVIEIMKWMYRDTDLYLQRKYDKFISFSKIREGRLEIVSKLRSANGKVVMDNVNKMINLRKEHAANS